MKIRYIMEMHEYAVFNNFVKGINLKLRREIYERI